MTQTKPSTMRNYAAAVGLLDFIVLSVSTVLTYVVIYQTFRLLDPIEASGTLRVEVDPQAVGLIMLVTWLLALVAFKTRDTKIIGSDFLEYRRIVNASLTVLGLLAFNSLFFKVDVSRVFVTSLIFFGLLALLLERRIARAWLKRQRLQGRYKKRIAIYGPDELTVHSVKRLSENKDHEFEPIFTISGPNRLKLKMIATGEEKEFDLQDLPEICKANNVQLLKVVGSSASPDMHKRLYWALDGLDISFVVSPAITGVSNSKLTTRLVAGTPLLEISSTKFTGPQYAAKTVMDAILGTIAFLISTPIVLVAAIIIKIQDGGPAFFKQTRVGLNGKEFTMYKLRSMKVGAELEHAERQAALAESAKNKNMFKDPEDPRVTKFGKVIRKYSIDELPQFLNVIKGNMSLVGPRPPLLSEVQEWKDHETRRLLVKPGVTGPWQIGGRSLLTWEETVAIDLNYVENWSVFGDLSIIFKTIVYVLRGRGAF